MASVPSLLVNAVTTFDGKALAKGNKQISGFDKSVKRLAGTFAATFSAAALANYGKNAIKAFAENEKSAIRLARVVKNLGLAFETPGIERNLDEISAKFGLQGEVLREAFQKLITVTGSAQKSQELLNLSLDVAAATGVDVLTVNQDLAAAYVGQTRGLRKYNLGLTQAELSTLKFDDAVTKLTTAFKGAAGEELDTYSGKLRVLKEAADNAQEMIGGALVDSLVSVFAAGDTTKFVSQIDALATKIADTVAAVVFGFQKLYVLTSDRAILASFNPFDDYEKNALAAIEAAEKAAKFRRNAPLQGYQGSQPLGIYETAADRAARRKADAAAAKRARDLATQAAKSLKSDKQKLALTKASAVFDSTRISLTAALRATYDKETKLRLEALIAIEEDKGDLALKKIGELAALQKNVDMQRLAGVEEISNATLASLNTQLLTELRVINDSKMAEGNKELAREEAFKKYNAAITAAGTLAARESYNERVQIQLTEIQRLASISKTGNAAITATRLTESAELSMIDRVAIAQRAADDQRLKALSEYATALGRVGSAAGAGGSLGLEDLRGKSGALGGLAAGVIAGVNPAALSAAPTLNAPLPNYGYNPSMGAPAQTVAITVNTGIGDPEAIARAVEDVMNQSSYRGTSVNRNTGVYAI